MISNETSMTYALIIGGAMFDLQSFEAKNRVFEFNHQYINAFEFLRFSKNRAQRVKTANGSKPEFFVGIFQTTQLLKFSSFFFSEECSNKGGVNAGSCASGFGVCCTCKF